MGVRGGVRRVVVVCGGFFLALSAMLGPPAADARGRDGDGDDEPRPTGVCEVPIRDSYDRRGWSEQVECSEGQPDHRPWLVTIRNASDIPVFINEWYGDGWHGQTTLLPKETKTLPIWPFAELWAGACWPGAGGPGTCQRGLPGRYASIEVLRWQDASGMNELWIRDVRNWGHGASTGDSWGVAINNSEYPVELTWPDLGSNEHGERIYVTVAPQGRTQPIPPKRGLGGRKDFGNGEVARVTVAATGGGEKPDLYYLVTPSERTGVPPFAVMTWLDGSWCSVTLHNQGPKFVRLIPWTIPYVPIGQGRELSLPVQQSATFRIQSGTLLITGHVGTAATGEFTTLRATDWRKCP